ncbi:MAG TPA: hypothetical protein VM262_11010 [Acidimicrobiales bacterium]|nr:hypothetical protein [Acidimicrobiales bacterium]
MKQQLALIDPPHRAWKLDRKTIEAGRKGVAEARAALAEAARRQQQQAA